MKGTPAEDHYHASAVFPLPGGRTYAVRWCGTWRQVTDAMGSYGPGYSPDVATVRKQKKHRPEGGPCGGHEEYSMSDEA